MSTIASTGGGGGSTGPGGSTGGGGGGSTMTGGGSSSTVVGWGDDWRVRMAAGSTDPDKEVKQLERYESPEQVWRKARELERRMSTGELRTTLKKDATSQEVAQWRKDNGIPGTPEEYKINMPAGKQPPKEDDAFLKSFLKSAHEAHYTQAQVDRAVGSFYAEVERQAQEVEDADARLVEETEEKLRQSWGSDYKVNKAMAESLLDRAPKGFKDNFLNGTMADGTPIKASVMAWKMLVQWEREINPMASVLPGAGGNLTQTAEVELNNLRKMMGNKQSEYWKGPQAEKNQARYRELITALDKAKARAAG